MYLIQTLAAVAASRSTRPDVLTSNISDHALSFSGVQALAKVSQYQRRAALPCLPAREQSQKIYALRCGVAKSAAVSPALTLSLTADEPFPESLRV